MAEPEKVAGIDLMAELRSARRPEGQKAIDPQMWNVVHFPALGILAKRVVWHQ